MLSLLMHEFSRELTTVVAEQQLQRLSTLSGLSIPQVVQNLDALAVGGLPRAAEFLHFAVSKAFGVECGFDSISAVVAIVHRNLAVKYNPEWTLIALAIAGVKTLPDNKLLPAGDRGGPLTALQAAKRGLLPLSEDQKRVEVRFHPAIVLSSLHLFEFSLSVEFREAAHYLASMPLMKPKNLWEEFVLRTLILRSHLPLPSELESGSGVEFVSFNTGAPLLVPNNGIMLPMTSSTAAGGGAPVGFRARIMRSVLNLFIIGAGGGNSRALVNGCMPDAPVFMAWPLSSVAANFPKKAPPSPDNLVGNPMMMRHVFTSQSKEEAGRGSMFFVRKAQGALGNPRDLIAVAIHCKYFVDEATPTLGANIVAQARKNFVKTMRKRGWLEEQLILVVLARCNLSGQRDAFMSSWGDNVVVLDQEAIAAWLGPSLMGTVQTLHNATASHGPYARSDDLMSAYATGGALK
jgi:hypothetical protein